MKTLLKSAWLPFIATLLFFTTGCDTTGEAILGLGAVGIILAILYFAVIIWAVVDITKKSYTITKKLVWVAVIIIIPFIGAILYFLIGKTSPSTPSAP